MERKETVIVLSSILLWWFCGEERFSKPEKMDMLPSHEISQESFLANCECEGLPCVCVQLVCSADAATSRRHNTLLWLLALANMCAPTGGQEKKEYLFS